MRDARIVCSESHQYVIDGSVGYVSVTELLKTQFPQFDAVAAATAMASRRSKNAPPPTDADVKEKLAEWDNMREQGVALHQRIDSFLRTREGQSVAESADDACFSQFMHFFEAVNSNFTEWRSEWKVFDSGANVAGTIDFVGLVGASEVVILDWKRAASIQFDGPKGRKGLPTGVCSDDPDCNYTRYMLQLHMYAYILENSYNLKVRQVQIVQFHPNQPKAHVFGTRDPKIDERVRALMAKRQKQTVSGSASCNGS